MDYLDEVKRFCESQKEQFGKYTKSDFYDGIQVGLDLVRTYVQLRLDVEGTDRANEYEQRRPIGV